MDTQTDPGADREWFDSHYNAAAGEINSAFVEEGISLEGKVMGDVGCGDGIMAMGVARHFSPELLVGFDINLTDCNELSRRAGAFGVDASLPTNLEFREAGMNHLPAGDGEFDLLTSWSAFEHIRQPIPVLREMRRILKDTGIVFIQIWPLYHSRHGSHLSDWFPDGWVQHRASHEEVSRTLQPEESGWGRYMLEEYGTLNRIDVDDLQRSLLAAGFRIAKFQMITGAFHVPADLQHHPISRLAVDGVKLLAVPA